MTGTGLLRNGNNMLGRVQRRIDMKHGKEVERVFNSNKNKVEDYNRELSRRESLLGSLKEGEFLEPLNEPILEPFPRKKNSRYLLG